MNLRVTSSTTIREAVKLFLQSSELENKSPNSIRAYKSDLNNFVEFISNIPISQLTEETVAQYRELLLQTTTAKSTFNRKIASLRSFLKFLNLQGVNNINLGILRSVKLKNKEAIYITEAEANTLFALLNTKINNLKHQPLTTVTIDQILSVLKYQALFTLLWNTGLRIQEALELKIDDLDLDEKQILVTGKGGKRRYVPVNTKTRDVLKNYIQKAKQLQKIRTYIFPGPDPEIPLSYTQAHRVFKENLKQAGITRNLTLHSIRHGFAAKAIQKGMDFKTLQLILGHASPTVTLNVYSHIPTKHIKQLYEHIFEEK